MDKIERAIDSLLNENDSYYEPGDSIKIDKGDKIWSDVYGEFWVTATGVVGGLWTSEYKDDIESGRGRGLRPQYVAAVQKQGDGPWYYVKIRSGEDIGTVIEVEKGQPTREGYNATSKIDSDSMYEYQFDSSEGTQAFYKELIKLGCPQEEIYKDSGAMIVKVNLPDKDDIDYTNDLAKTYGGYLVTE